MAERFDRILRRSDRIRRIVHTKLQVKVKAEKLIDLEAKSNKVAG